MPYFEEIPHFEKKYFEEIPYFEKIRFNESLRFEKSFEYIGILNSFCILTEI